MADVKISALPASTTPLAGTEVLPIVQGTTTKQVAVSDLTVGRAVSANSFIPSSSTTPSNGMYLYTGNTLGWSTNSAQRMLLSATGLAVNSATFTTTYNAGGGTSASLGYSISPTGWNIIHRLITAVGGNNSYWSTNWNSTARDDTGYGSSYILQDTGSIQFAVGPANPVERMRVHASGGVSIGNTTDPGAGVLFVSSGVRFPATQVPSADANTLDDYEEGTWTPSVASSVGTITTIADKYGTYTKVGNTVNVRGYFNIAVNGTGAGNISVTGLPFAISSVGGNLVAYPGCGNEILVTGISLTVIGSAGGNNLTLLTYAGLYPGLSGYGLYFSINYQV